MGNKLTLNDVGNLQNESSVVTVLAQNNRAIEAAVENTLSRDGTYPNYMQDNLDMNSKRILNLPVPIVDTDPVRLIDIADIGNVTINSIPAGGTTGQALTKNSNVDYDIVWNTPTVTGSLPVGGTAGQFLKKNSVTNYDATWSGLTASDITGSIPDAKLSFTPQDTVASMAALKALAPGSHSSVNLLGYTTPGDGGEGLFVWNAVSTATDNTGTIIQPNAGGTGRWIRAWMYFYTPGMFGAKGDGTDDKAFVQKAIDSINTLGGGTLYFDKVYSVGGAKHANTFSIIDLKSGVNFAGPGGLKLLANTNVADSSFTASFSGTTMTVTGATGTIALNQFLSVANNVALLQVASFGTGTGGNGTYVLTAAPVTSGGTPITGPIACKGINRMVELAGAYNTTSNNITNTFYEDIIFDYNGANNCASGTIWSFNSVVTIQTCSSIAFNSVRFRNNCGSNSLCLGTAQTTLTASRITLNGCSYENDGDRINPSCVDYSTLFTYVDGLTVNGSRFALGPTLNGTAWEVYGNAILFSGNSVSDYYTMSNICAVANQTTQGVSLVSNIGRNLSSGITLWMTASTSRLKGINIKNNIIDIKVASPGGPYFVNGVDQVVANSIMDGVDIVGNRWQNFDLSDTARTNDGIGLKGVQGCNIVDNYLYGAPGRGIFITGATDPTSISVQDNKLINIGYCATAGLKKGIVIPASGTTGTVQVIGNEINPISGYTLTTGIDLGISATLGIVDNNNIVGATTLISSTGSGIYVMDKTSPWATYSATLTSSVGTPTTAAVTSARWRQIGRTVYVQGTYTVTTIGTASGAALFTLPVNAKSGVTYCGSGSEIASTGKGFQTRIDAADNTKIRVLNSDGTTTWVNGTNNNITIIYEAA